MTDLTIDIGLKDPELLDATCEEYARAVDLGEITAEEAEDNLNALVVGMITLSVKE